MPGGYGFSLEGWDKARREFVRMGVQADAIARRNVSDMAMRLIKLAQANFEGSHAKGEPHVGGIKPNMVSGNLRRSIQAQGGVRQVGLGVYSTTVGPTAKYGRRVELGYKNMNRPFPYFGPASHKVRAEAEAIAMDNWLELWRR